MKLAEARHRLGEGRITVCWMVVCLAILGLSVYGCLAMAWDAYQ